MYCEILHRALLEGQWQQALKICRMGQHSSLWATLAAVATRKHQLQISEEAYSARSLSLGLDVLAIRDNSDPTVLHLFDLIPGASRQYDPHSLRAKQQLVQIAACRAGSPEDQFVAFIDSNRELFVSESRNLNSERIDEIYKIGTQLTAIMWASETNILVGVHDSCYSIWYCPGEGASDPTIIALTRRG